MIICSSCLNILNIRFNILRSIWCFDKKFKKFIDFKTQHFDQAKIGLKALLKEENQHGLFDFLIMIEQFKIETHGPKIF